MSVKVFYNEIDPYCCAWISNLMDAGRIRPGMISDKSIADLTPDEVAPYDLAHFFAGIAGWDAALTLAGWRYDSRVTWTGSCPCQPFSAAGAGKAADDKRHLWPAWFRLIDACRPPVIFGEQVAAAAVVGLAGAEAALCDGEPEEQQSLRTDQACEAEGGKEEIAFRSGRLFDGDTEENRQRFVRGDGIAAQLGGWPNLGQSVTRPHRTQEWVSLREHSDRLSRHQQRDGGLGRTESSPIGVGDFIGEETEVGRVLAAIAEKFGPTIEWPWLDLVQSDLEGAGYTIGAAVLPACSVGAPHIRQRLWFVADSTEPGWDARRRAGKAREGRDAPRVEPGRLRDAGELADAVPAGRPEGRSIAGNGQVTGGRASGFLADANGRDAAGELADADGRDASAEGLQRGWQQRQFEEDGGAGELADADAARPQGRSAGRGSDAQRTPVERGGAANPWSDLVWLPCSDGKARPTQPGVFPLADRSAFMLGSGGALEGKSRVRMLRAYGNCIVPPLAAEFIKACM